MSDRTKNIIKEVLDEYGLLNITFEDAMIDLSFKIRTLKVSGIITEKESKEIVEYIKENTME